MIKQLFELNKLKTALCLFFLKPGFLNPNIPTDHSFHSRLNSLQTPNVMRYSMDKPLPL